MTMANHLRTPFQPLPMGCVFQPPITPRGAPRQQALHLPHLVPLRPFASVTSITGALALHPLSPVSKLHGVEV